MRVKQNRRWRKERLFLISITILSLSVAALSAWHTTHLLNTIPRVHARHRVAVKPAISRNGTATRQLAQALPATAFSGTAIIVQNGRVIAQLSRGYADRKTQQPNTLKTLYEIDSVQKSLTAAMVMRQIQAGKLSMTTKLSRFYPNIPGANEITIQHLLDMTSGLSIQGQLVPSRSYGDAAVIANLRPHLRFVAKQLNLWHYQPANYMLLAGVLAQLDNVSYQELFMATYLQGLGLTQTRFAYAADQTDFAQGYGWGARGLADAPQINATVAQQHMELGTGQVMMSALDLYKAEAALQNGQLLTVASRAFLFAPGSAATYGGGLYQAPTGYRFANGSGYGFQCFLRISNDGRSAVVVMANCTPPNALVKNAADRLATEYVR
ncbi:serine hydrolase domain-containing protein [Lacticaseibacillus baoqingensis]|uniref:Serine hydrolase domain-containing protein n=1 Tax=Lacticaseibacillus baoqingensis TaxID=2486013 RepID=A0ABW4E6E5_9LACO|nr:serine hydrolase domain-containing protein [Lacticaseibacillus baoqingensis]